VDKLICFILYIYHTRFLHFLKIYHIVPQPVSTNTTFILSILVCGSGIQKVLQRSVGAHS